LQRSQPSSFFVLHCVTAQLAFIIFFVAL
jgi:hypothetical protein